MSIATPPAKKSLAEDEIERAIGVADAALAVAGHEASEFGRDVTRRFLRGELADTEAVDLLAKDAEERH